MNKKRQLAVGLLTVALVIGLIITTGASAVLGQDSDGLTSQLYLPLVSPGTSEEIVAAVAGGDLKGTPPTCPGGMWYQPAEWPAGWRPGRHNGVDTMDTGGNLPSVEITLPSVMAVTPGDVDPKNAQEAVEWWNGSSWVKFAHTAQNTWSTQTVMTDKVRSTHESVTIAACPMGGTKTPTATSTPTPTATTTPTPTTGCWGTLNGGTPAPHAVCIPVVVAPTPTATNTATPEPWVISGAERDPHCFAQQFPADWVSTWLDYPESSMWDCGWPQSGSHELWDAGNGYEVWGDLSPMVVVAAANASPEVVGSIITGISVQRPGEGLTEIAWPATGQTTTVSLGGETELRIRSDSFTRKGERWACLNIQISRRQSTTAEGLLAFGPR